VSTLNGACFSLSPCPLSLLEGPSEIVFLNFPSVAVNPNSGASIYVADTNLNRVIKMGCTAGTFAAAGLSNCAPCSLGTYSSWGAASCAAALVVAPPPPVALSAAPAGDALSLEGTVGAALGALLAATLLLLFARRLIAARASRAAAKDVPPPHAALGADGVVLALREAHSGARAEAPALPPQKHLAAQAPQ
jgi:hypothetical protein